MQVKQHLTKTMENESTDNKKVYCCSTSDMREKADLPKSPQQDTGGLLIG